MNEQIIYTNEAKCRDCYKCLRNCPVNAIRMNNNQASIIEERCILCGNCIKNCPQGAKRYRKDIRYVKELINNYDTAISIAPSFISFFNESQIGRIPSLLRRLGFVYVSETSTGAGVTARKSAEIFYSDSEKCLGSACPAAVNYVEKQRPELIGNLSPVISPAAAHAKIIKKKLSGDAKVVFAGPCIAKKGEAERLSNKGLIDAVLTFEELFDWIEEEKINIDQLEESEFDLAPEPDSVVFPVAGGFIESAGMVSNYLTPDSLSVAGFEEIEEAFSALKENPGTMIESLMCKSGCINGPGVSSEINLFTRRKRILEYASVVKSKGRKETLPDVDLTAVFKKAGFAENKFSEEEINEVLETTGKINESDHLNCGACGYSSCREKAIAVLEKNAEREMCIPYMRKTAERRTDKIIETSPNGILILNDRLEIIHMNPAFQKFFKCTNSVLGKNLSYLMDPEPFVKLKTGPEERRDVLVNHPNYNLICNEIIYRLKDENQIVGIFVNVTRNKRDLEELDDMKRNTIMQAQDLLGHQIEMAQSLAKFLGENTAKGEALVENLLKITQSENRKDF